MNEVSRVTSFQLERGKPTTINLNRPVKFKMGFIHGTYIEGTIPPNNGLTVCDKGDITEFFIVIDDESTKTPALVELSPPERVWTNVCPPGAARRQAGFSDVWRRGQRLHSPHEYGKHSSAGACEG